MYIGAIYSSLIEKSTITLIDERMSVHIRIVKSICLSRLNIDVSRLNTKYPP